MRPGLAGGGSAAAQHDASGRQVAWRQQRVGARRRPFAARHAGCHAARRRLTDGSESSNSFECWSHSAACRMSASRIKPLLLLYANRLHCRGWKSAHVMTCRAKEASSQTQLDITETEHVPPKQLLTPNQLGGPGRKHSIREGCPAAAARCRVARPHTFPARTSVRSSMLCGLMSTMLNAWSCLQQRRRGRRQHQRVGGEGRSDPRCRLPQPPAWRHLQLWPPAASAPLPIPSETASAGCAAVPVQVPQVDAEVVG